MSARIAILDDEPRMVDILAMVLRREGYEVRPFGDPEVALAEIEKHPVDCLLSDLKMPGMDGVEVLRRAKAASPDLPVILITAHATVSNAIEAMRLGAFDYVEKPFDNTELKTLVKRALDHTRLARENRYLRAEVGNRYAPGAIVAESEALREVLDLARRAARSSSSVLIQGESGTGKELVARLVHFHSERVGQPFLAVNCRAFAEGVLESELFGHEKGAFTGAERARAGLFERADGGTLFLDEIGEIDAAFQAKLLRVLQDGSFQRVGGDAPRKADVRIVAASNRNLREAVSQGVFREDLYFRLAVIPVSLPPLRERREDLLPLARHFLAKTCEGMDRRIHGWSDAVEAFLVSHDWPGNVRELENTIERGVVLARGECIELPDLLVEAGSGDADDPQGDLDLQAFLDRAAADRIREVLTQCDGKRVEAARRLGIDRTTLYRLMRRHTIE